MNDSKSLNSSNSFNWITSTTTNNVDEIICSLEIYIECLDENSKIFQNFEHPSNIQMEEFLLEYVNLEDKVLFCFDRLRNFKIRNRHRNIIEDLIRTFNLCWKDYQDVWNSQMWEMYNKIRNEELLKLPLLYDEDCEMSNVRVPDYIGR
jgi:hypothetical protein